MSNALVNQVATLSLGVTTARSAEELAALTAALRNFKTALAEFNTLKAANPMATLVAQTQTASQDLAKNVKQGAKTMEQVLSEAGESGGRKFAVGFSTKLSNGVSASFKSIGTDVLGLVNTIGAGSEQMLALFGSNGIKTAQGVRDAMKKVADDEKARIRELKQGGLGLGPTGTAQIALKGDVQAALDRNTKNSETAEKARLQAWFARKDAENRAMVAASKAANETMQRELDSIAKDAVLKARQRAEMQALNESEHRKMIYRQRRTEESAQARGNALNLAGERAAQIARLKEGLAYGPDRGDRARLEAAHYIYQTKEAARAKKELEKAAKDAGNAVKESSGHLYTTARAMNDAHSAARGLASGFGAMWLTWGNIAPLLAGAAISHGLVQATKAGSEFNYQLTFVKALGNESAAAIKLVSDNALELSRGSLYGPVELANGLRMLSQSGLNAGEAMQALPAVMNLATVGEMTMAAAGLTLAGVMNAFSLSVSDFDKIGDVFAKAAAVSQTSVEQMTQAMKTASVVGEQYGASMTDTAAALTLLARVNITGTAAGTSLRNMLKELYTPTDQVASVMKKLGLSSSDAKGNLRPFADIIYDLRGKLEGYDKISQTNILQKLFGERGSKEAMAMLSQTREEWDKLVNQLKEADGFSKKVSDQLEQSSKGLFKQALNTLQSSMIEAFQGAEGPMQELAKALKNLAGSPELINGLTMLVTGFAKLATAVVSALPAILEIGKALVTYVVARSAISGIASLSEGFIKLAAASGGMAGGMSTAAAMSSTLGSRLLGLLNPITLIAAGLTAGVMIWDSWGSAAARAIDKASKNSASTREGLEETLRDLRNDPSMQTPEAAVSAARTSTKALEKANADLVEARRKILEKQDPLGLKIKDLANSSWSVDEMEAKSSGDAWIRRDLVALRELQDQYDTLLKLNKEFQDLAKERTPANVNTRLKTGSKKLGSDDPDLSAQLNAGKSGILEDYRTAERRAKMVYDTDVALANKALELKIVDQKQYDYWRESAQKAYLGKVKSAEVAAFDEIEKLKIKTEKESQKAQLDLAVKTIKDRQAEEKVADAESLRRKTAEQNFGLISESKKLEATSKKLAAEESLERNKQRSLMDRELVRESEQAAMEAEVSVIQRFSAEIAKAKERLAEATAGGFDDYSVKRYREALDRLVETQNEQIRLTVEETRAREEYHRSFAYGSKVAFAQFDSTSTNAAEHAKTMWKTTFDAMTEQLAQFFRTGKGSWRSFADAVLMQIARIAAAQTASGLVKLAGSMWPGGNTGTVPAGSLGDTGTVRGGTITSANGNVFGATPFANGGAFTNSLVTSPTYFAFAQGGAFRRGLMGEAGPEAVMPLARDSAGRLGVRMQGGGEGVVVNVSVVVNQDGSSTQTIDSGSASTEAKLFARGLERAIRGVLIDEKRPGGLLAAG